MIQASQPLSPPVSAAISLDLLANCVRRLDPGTRALLDLSVRRGLRDDKMAPLLHTDPFHLAWRRARALEHVASELGGEAAAPLAAVRSALIDLPPHVFTELPELASASEEPRRPGLALVVRSEVQEPLLATLPIPQPASVAIAPADPDARRVGLAARLDSLAVSAPPLRESLRLVFVAAAGAFARVFLRRGHRSPAPGL